MRIFLIALIMFANAGYSQQESGRFSCDHQEGADVKVRLGFTPYRDIDDGFLGNAALKVEDNQVTTLNRYNNLTLNTTGEDLFLRYPDGSLKLVHSSDNYYGGYFTDPGSARTFTMKLDCIFAS